MFELRDYEKEELLNLLDYMDCNDGEFCIKHGNSYTTLPYLEGCLIREIILSACEDE